MQSPPTPKNLFNRLRAKARGLGTVAGAAVGADPMAAGVAASPAVVVPAAIGVGALAFGLSAAMVRVDDQQGKGILQQLKSSWKQSGRETPLDTVKQKNKGARPWAGR